MTDHPTPPPSDPLHASAMRLSAATPGFIGYWLDRHRRHERLSEFDLTVKLRTRLHKLPLIALSHTPRPDHFDADVRAVAARCDADPAVLAAVICGEQARLARKAADTPSPANPVSGPLAT